MNLIKVSIERPIAVIAAVLMIVMFGWVALQAIPIQLAPDVSKPVIEIETRWPGAAPAEIEREIVNRQEDELAGLDGLVEMESSSQNGTATVTLTFRVGTNMDRALLLTANRLDRVGDYPDEADEPTLSTTEGNERAIAWMLLYHADGNETPIHHYGQFAEDVIQARLERIPGVARSNVFGGSDPEMQVIVDPDRMARYGLTIGQIVQSLRAANVSATAGDVEEGKRRYIVRTEGEFERLDQVREVLLLSGEDPVTGSVGRVTVGDIADVRMGYQDRPSIIRFMGREALAINVQRATGANVIEIMRDVRTAIDEMNARAVPDRGLVLELSYDETVYVNSAIDLVQQNIVVGGILAAVMLMLFLRSARATLVVSLAIPVSVIGSFVAMAALGRSINVISLAGIAFAVGMVVDAAIVVLENIFRLRQAGMPARQAAYQGAAQVWGAVLVSALTTVMVFIPVLVLELEVGQLFRDIAVAISVSVLLSLLVAVTVIPALSSRLLGGGAAAEGKSLTRLRLPVIDDIAGMFVRGITGFTRWIVRRRAVALGVVTGVSATALTVAALLLPDLEYLPDGNQNFIFGALLPPPGYNLDTTTQIAERMETATRDLWTREQYVPTPPGEPPRISAFFFVASPNFTFTGARSADPARTRELIPVLRTPIFAEPGTFAFIRQSSLFGSGIGGSRSIELDISGGDLATILSVAQQATGLVFQTMPDNQSFRPQPGLELGAPEVRVLPDRLRLSDNDLSALDLAQSVDAYNDGLRVAEITVDGERIDLTVKGPQDAIRQTQGIGAIPVVTGQGMILPVESLSEVQVTSGPTEILHKERERTVSLEIVPPNDLALETAVDVLTEGVIGPLEAQGLPEGVTLRISGTADELERTWTRMQADLIVALVIVFLVMAVLFESFFYPLIIMVSVPMAAAGGVIGLTLVMMVDSTQRFDMLTLLGFVILIGIVVNNAILLVHQSLYHFREEGMTVDAAITEATHNRIRPIFMSTLTSLFGMLPLVVVPGAGSELYRGLGSVVLGGLSLSAVLTLLVIPPLLTLFMGVIEGRRRQPPTPPEVVTPEPVDDGPETAADAGGPLPQPKPAE